MKYNFLAENITDDISQGNYNFFSVGSFFVEDAVRLIKILHIFASFILNLLYIISYIKIKHSKRIHNKNSFSFILIINILIANFIHTFSFLLNWMKFIKNDYWEFNDNSKLYRVGGLLIGNPLNKMETCKIQGFLMIYSSLSQDLLINIFFYIIDRGEIPEKFKFQIILIIFSFFIPLLFSFIYLITNNIGINERYCHIKKFYFKDNAYHFNKSFIALTSVLYSFRGINLIISCVFLYRIIKSVKLDEYNKIYFLRIAIILITQILAISLEIINVIFEQTIGYDYRYIFSDLFLIMNTFDGIIFPLIISFSNSTYSNLFCKKERERSETIITEDEYNNESCESSARIDEKIVDDKKRFSLAQCIDSNNFDNSF